MRLWLSGASREVLPCWRGSHTEGGLAGSDTGGLGSPTSWQVPQGRSPAWAQLLACHHPDCMSWNGDRQRRDNPVLSREVWTGTTFQRKRTRGCRSEEPQQAHLGAALGDPGGSYLPQYKIGRPVFLSSTKCSPKANSFSWVSIYYHLKCHSLHG